MKQYKVTFKHSKDIIMKATAQGATFLAAIADFYDSNGYCEIIKFEFDKEI